MIDKVIKPTLFLILLLTMGTMCLEAQVIDSIRVNPSGNITTNDTIKIFIFNTFPSGGCAGSANFGQNGFTIGASALHCLGPLAVICHDVDTVILPPPHNPGNYTFGFVLNAGFGGPPCSPPFVPNDYDTTYFTVSNGSGNQPPSITTTLPHDTICMNDTLGPISWMISDEDPATVTVTATSNNQVLVPNANISISGTTNNRQVTVVPALNKTGTVDIKLLIEDNGGLKDSTNFQLTVRSCLPVGISEAGISLLSAFPNPADTYLTIHSESIIERVEILSLTGKIITSHVSTEASKTVKASTISFEDGIYILKVYSSGGIAVTRLVIQH